MKTAFGSNFRRRKIGGLCGLLILGFFFFFWAFLIYTQPLNAPNPNAPELRMNAYLDYSLDHNFEDASAYVCPSFRDDLAQSQVFPNSRFRFNFIAETTSIYDNGARVEVGFGIEIFNDGSTEQYELTEEFRMVRTVEGWLVCDEDLRYGIWYYFVETLNQDIR